jgi:hypothetical protein
MRFPSGFVSHSGNKATNFVVLTLLVLLAPGVRAQVGSHEIPAGDQRIADESDGLAESGRLLREIDDPNSGTRWLLRRDKTNPGGPGRLEMASPGTAPRPLRGQAKARLVAPTGPEPVIRPGDKLVVEEHSATTDAYLEGMALGSAGPGSALNVRLSIGWRVVRVMAVAPGRAALAAAMEARR